MTIKLNEFDKKLLSQITPSSKWDKLKSIYAINSVVKQLKIGNKKIGQKCAKHLQKLSKQDSTNINEIREGCMDLRIKKKQPLPLAKDKTKRPVESVHKINKATEKPPTGKTKGGTGAAQPQADLLGGLFTAFKQQEAKQARDAQYAQLSAEVSRQIPQGAAGDALRERMKGPAAEAYLDALREGTDISGLSLGENLLYRELLNRKDMADQARKFKISGDYSMKSDSVALLDELERKIAMSREQDLSGFSIPPSPRSAPPAPQPLFRSVEEGSSAPMFNPTTEERNQLAMDLFQAREKGLESLERSAERKQKIFRERMEQANIYKEQQKQSMVQNKVGIQTENYINKQRKKITDAVLDKNMNHKEAQKKLRDLNLYYLKLLDAEQQERVNKNIFEDIETIERDRQFRLRDRKAGVDSVLSRVRDRKTQELQDRLVNDLIINENEKKMEDIQSELLGAVRSRVSRADTGSDAPLAKKQQEGEQTLEQLQKVQMGIMDRISGLAEQQSIFEQKSQSQLGITRTQSGEMIKPGSTAASGGSAPSLSTELQRTKSAPAVQALDVGRAERTMKEQVESEAEFNRKQRALASQIQDIQRTDSLLDRMEADAIRSLSEMSAEEFALEKTKSNEPPLMAFGEEDNPTGSTIVRVPSRDKKESPREKFRIRQNGR